MVALGDLDSLLWSHLQQLHDDHYFLHNLCANSRGLWCDRDRSQHVCPFEPIALYPDEHHRYEGLRSMGFINRSPSRGRYPNCWSLAQIHVSTSQ